jgi:hypothetical protein
MVSLVQAVAVGAFIFIVGQIVQRFLLEPMQEQRRVIGDIATAYLMYANIGHVAQNQSRGLELAYPETPEQASRNLRLYASRMHASLWTIPFYRLWSFLGFVPRRRAVRELTRELVRWSNSLHQGQPGIPREEIAKLLNLPREG